MPHPETECPGDELFRRFLDRQLPAHELAALQLHIDRCPACMALVLALARSATAPPQAQSAPLSAAPPRPGDPPEHIEEYRLLRPIGRGTMGQAFHAHDTLLDRPVAIKLLAARDPDAAARERFFVEARAVARLSHPNVVRVYRVGELAGRPFLVSELVPGRSLDRLALPLAPEQVIDLGLGLCRGLSAAHQRGILHRDIKPANAILTDGGEVKLLDFGLAKLRDAQWLAEARDGEAAPGAQVPEPPESPRSPHAPPSMTRTGAVLGTPYYLAPELWERAAATEQSDLYALGALLYELCAGRPPHQARTLRELLRRVQRKPIRPLREVARDVPRGLAEIVDRCLQRRPQDRFASAEELCSALERLRAPLPVPAAPPRPLERRLRAVRAGSRALCYVRRSEIDEVLNLLQRDRLVVVAGDAGAGKSALCRRGVLPAACDGALRDGRAWSAVRLRPGRRPLGALAGALAPWLGADPRSLLPRLRSDPGSIRQQLTARQPERAGLILFIDQAEELLTRSDAGEAAEAAELVGRLDAENVRTLLAVRSGSLARLASLPGLADGLTRALFLLQPLSAASALAIARCRRAEDPQILRKLGAAYRELGQRDAAAALLELAVEHDPRDARARRLLALTHAGSGHLEAALTQAREAVGLQPQSARAWRLLGRLSLRARDVAAAREALQQALVLQPDHRLALRWLGEALLDSDRAAEAALCFEQAAALGLAALSRTPPSLRGATETGRTPR
jgi:serine/threonine protein kinase